MFAMALAVVVALFAGWAYLLYRFHRTLANLDPDLARQIGKPSLFWTAWNGHAKLVEVIRRKDLDAGALAPLAGQARLLRGWAIALVAALLWLVWASYTTPGLA